MEETGIISDSFLYDRCGSETQLKIVGLFSSAVYFTDPSGQVIVLHDGCYGALPFGIGLENGLTVEKHPETTLDRTATLSGYVLTVPAIEREIRLYYRPIPLPDDAPSLAELRMLADCIREELAYSEKSELFHYALAWPDLPDRESFSDPFVAAARPGMEKFRNALQNGVETDLDAALARLLGLGRGLTPSLDDFLFVFLYTLRVLNRPEDRQLYTLMSEQMLQTADARTNLFSAAYLKAAATRGRFSLLDDCLFSRDPRLCRQAVARLAAVGGSSGTDMLAGMLLCLKYVSYSENPA